MAQRKRTRRPKAKEKVQAVYDPDSPEASPVNGLVPPKATRFKKGNPGGPGRPRDPVKGIGQALRSLLDKGMEVDGKIVNLPEALARRAITQALRGKDIRWWIAVIERVEGRVPARTELTGKDGEPLKIEDGRDRLAEAIQRHAAAAEAPVEDDEGSADPVNQEAKDERQ